MILSNPSSQRLGTLHPNLRMVVESAASKIWETLEQEYSEDLEKAQAAVDRAEAKGQVARVIVNPPTEAFEIIHADDHGRHEQVQIGDEFYALAVDIAPRAGFGPGVEDWEAEGYSDDDEQHMRRIVKAMLDASKSLNIPISYGGDFREDGKKQRPRNWRSPHFELTTKE